MPKNALVMLCRGALASLALFTCSIGSAQAQQFSADLVRASGEASTAGPVGRIFVSGEKVRFELSAFPDGFFLIDGARETAYFVRPLQRIFMEARQSSPLSRILVPVQPDNPCAGWQIMAEKAGIAASGDTWRCALLGEEVFEGRATVRYRTGSSESGGMLAWINSELKFPLKVKIDDGAIIALVNIKEGPQAQALFDMPNGFRKFDPHTLIERIKKSDVWVGEPDLQ